MFMEELIEALIVEGYLRTPRIITAFRAIHREDFLPDELKAEAAINAPLPIGHEQTISQPLTVAFMLELLMPEPGQNVLDVGAGSGWQTALLAHVVGSTGRVTAIERIPELRAFGEENVKRYGFSNVTFVTGDGSKGYPDRAPFDRIIVAAAAERIPDALPDQLAVSGRLVIPVGEGMQDIVVLERVSDDGYREERHPGFQFVPLIEAGA